MKNALMRLRGRVDERVDLSSDRSGMALEAMLVLGSIIGDVGVVWWAI
ncbi:hypothetical protein HG717_16060 [Rhodococcus erythropolis]|nr:hypothetical protein [Rhodococcus erythropolis]MBY6385414.1 hypothetical protein [Rhodococcus erythropolis]